LLKEIVGIEAYRSAEMRLRKGSKAGPADKLRDF
jgi:hypothetical protein